MKLEKYNIWMIIGIIGSIITIVAFTTNKSSVQDLASDIPVLGKKILKCKYLQNDFSYFNYYLSDNESHLAEVKAYGDGATCTMNKSCPVEIFQLRSTASINQYYDEKISRNDAIRSITRRLLTINKNSMDFSYEFETQNSGVIPMPNQYFRKAGGCEYVRESQIPNYFSFY